MNAVDLELHNVVKRYGPITAVDDLSLKVPAGQICVLVGPSGCGKTTAMRMVNRMIDITEGDILIEFEGKRYGITVTRTATSSAPCRWPSRSASAGSAPSCRAEVARRRERTEGPAMLQ